MPQIVNEQIIDVYEKFKNYYVENEKEFPSLQQRTITNYIVSLIQNEKKFAWNITSLTDYVNDLVYMVRGEQFARTINKFAETYFIDNMCKDFGPLICENAKKSLALHQKYYRELTNSEDKSLKKFYKEYFPQLLSRIKKRKPEFDSSFKIDQIYNTEADNSRHYVSFPSGKSNIKYSCVYPKSYGNGLVVELYFDGKNYNERFENLLKHKNEIENAYGENLIWQEDTSNARRVFISLYCNIKNKKDWNTFINWQIDNLIKFRRIFQQYIDTIDDGVNLQNITPIVAKNEDTFKIKNILLYGVPGVGKTHNIKKLISMIEQGINQDQVFEEIEKNTLFNNYTIDAILNEKIRFVTFHQNFGYEDFIEGFRPNEKGDIGLEQGIFNAICKEAKNHRNENYYLVIDEINRGNISKIFGELITLIEEDKRDAIEVILPYSKQPFTIPTNLFIIGTMNSTDKSIALIDIALRRRFTFVKMKPNYALISDTKSRSLLETLNQKIYEKLGEDYQIGHSYFMKIENDADLFFVIKYKIIPLLEEYFYGDMDGLNDVLSVFEK